MMGSPIIFGLISDEETKKRRYYICSFRRSNIWSEMYSCNCTTRQPYSQNQFVYRMKKKIKNKKWTLILVFKNLVLLRKLIMPLCLFLTEKNPVSSNIFTFWRMWKSRRRKISQKYFSITIFFSRNPFIYGNFKNIASWN